MPRLRNDLGLYDRHAADWWRSDSAFSCSLHAVNRLCLEEIVAEVGADLTGRIVVDLGCGGGLVAKPLAERGAVVVAGDLSRASLHELSRHADGLAMAPVLADARQAPFADASADLVLCADILEHIPGWRQVLAQAARLVKPGGRIFVSTLTRTWLSSLIGVHLAEGLGFVPAGTHDPRLLITPDEVAACACGHGLRATPAVGLTPRLLASAWSGELKLRRTPWVLVSYTMWLTRPAHGEALASGALEADRDVAVPA
jgi:2-polyprenyl-6-hydroxyphenyl methylase/3-demethylubiquinone-9 3-methyltransferase